MAEMTQKDYWNGSAAARWVSNQDALDRVFRPIERACLDKAAPVAGERVADIGCGCGGGAMELARLVGPTGSVLGLDISAPMLARARERADGLIQLDLRLGDAGTFAFQGDRTLLYSRFGVMFFDDPPAAFRNLRAALAPGGRFTFVCWRVPEDNPWYNVPLRAALTALGFSWPPPPGNEAGPFAFASNTRLRQVLTAGGFTDVDIARFDTPLTLSETSLDEAAAFAVQAGPLARLLPDITPDQRKIALDTIGRVLLPHQRNGAVTLDSSVWLVHAR